MLTITKTKNANDICRALAGLNNKYCCVQTEISHSNHYLHYVSLTNIHLTLHISKVGGRIVPQQNSMGTRAQNVYLKILVRKAIRWIITFKLTLPVHRSEPSSSPKITIRIIKQFF